MQRLFSIFPTGAAGIALLVFRIGVAAAFVLNLDGCRSAANSPWILVVSALSSILLGLGLLTPYCATLFCLAQLGLVLECGSWHDGQLIFSIVNSAVLAVLGPGAYSVDARIFGRRLLTVPPGR